MKILFIIIPLIIIGIIILNRKKHETEELYSLEDIYDINSKIDQTEDQPTPFGYKISWLAIPSDDSDSIIKSLNLKDVRDCNWKSGIDIAYTSNQLFVTPSINGWTFIVGTTLDNIEGDEIKDKEFINSLEKLSEQFSEIYYFGTHRIVEYHCWIKTKNGKLERGYSYLGESGEVLLDQGDKLKEEIELKLNFFDPSSKEAEKDEYFERDDLRYPDEEDVIILCKELTKIDLENLNQYTSKGLGKIGKK